jgi:hypothetical protein
MMQDNILTRKHRKGKKPVKVRKPSKPIDGINHRLLDLQAEKQQVEQPAVVATDDNAAPTRIELVDKAKELGLAFTKRTSDEKLLAMIAEALNKTEA